MEMRPLQMATSSFFITPLTSSTAPSTATTITTK
jgi:hypothetical protein